MAKKLVILQNGKEYIDDLKTVNSETMYGTGDITIDGLPAGVADALLYFNAGVWKVTTDKLKFDGTKIDMIDSGTGSLQLNPGSVISNSDGTDFTTLKPKHIYQSVRTQNSNTPCVWSDSGELTHLPESSSVLDADTTITTVSNTMFPLLFNVPQGLKVTENYRLHFKANLYIDINSAAVNEDFYVSPVLGATGITMTPELVGKYTRRYYPSGSGVTALTDFYENCHDWNSLQGDTGGTRNLQIEERYLIEIEFIANVQTDSTYTGGNVGLALYRPTPTGTMTVKKGSFLKTAVIGDINYN